MEHEINILNEFIKTIIIGETNKTASRLKSTNKKAFAVRFLLFINVQPPFSL